MEERVVELVGHELVDRRLGSLEDHLDLLARLPLEFAHHPAEALEHLLDRHEPEFGRGILHLAHDHPEPVDGPVEGGKLQPFQIGRMDRLGHRKRELAHEIHEPADLLGGDAQEPAVGPGLDRRAHGRPPG
ncbi:hypothetical protein [Cereibacter sphaeroides]|uniref:hypothetical protein n=1 Tax=Cereibacter sphaeroides TaxID=1063 RepID=UPI001FFCCB1A|nr:hypothetical protein [Cereibacter sphaeroides]